MPFALVPQIFNESYERFVAPLSRISGSMGDRWFFLYLGFSLGFTLLVVAARTARPNGSLISHLRAVGNKLFDRDVLLHESAKLDYRFALINHVFTALIWAYVLVAISTLTEVTNRVFSSMVFLEGRALNLGWFAPVIIVALYAFAYDTAGFFQHMLQHKVPMLWEFHKVHHSAHVLTPVTVLRVHPVGQLVNATIGALVYGGLNGLTFVLFAGDLARFTVIGVNWFGLLYYTLGLYHLKHSHVWVQFPRGLREIFASPSLHLIHHSNNPIHYDKNYGFVFTFWDRVFGSYYQPTAEEHAGLTLGIDESEGASDLTTVAGLYLAPFRRVFQRRS